VILGGDDSVAGPVDDHVITGHCQSVPGVAVRTDHVLGKPDLLAIRADDRPALRCLRLPDGDRHRLGVRQGPTIARAEHDDVLTGLRRRRSPAERAVAVALVGEDGSARQRRGLENHGIAVRIGGGDAEVQALTGPHHLIADWRQDRCFVRHGCGAPEVDSVGCDGELAWIEDAAVVHRELRAAEHR